MDFGKHNTNHQRVSISTSQTVSPGRWTPSQLFKKAQQHLQENNLSEKLLVSFYRSSTESKHLVLLCLCLLCWRLCFRQHRVIKTVASFPEPKTSLRTTRILLTACLNCYPLLNHQIHKQFLEHNRIQQTVNNPASDYPLHTSTCTLSVLLLFFCCILYILCIVCATVEQCSHCYCISNVQWQ